VNESTNAITLVLSKIVYVQFMIMLIELQEVLSLEPKCLCSKTITVNVRMNCTKNY